MDRRNFIKTGCLACIGVATSGTLLQSCAGVKYATGKLNDNGMLIPLSEFDIKHKEEGKKRPYIIARHDELKYPICIYRLDNGSYSALLMSCSHQGAELQVSGERLTCPAHGSEFDNTGRAMQSPATSDLRTFPVTIQGDQLFIDLRKQA
ncbi:MAG: hypothetical protein EBZ77_14740 [Chitinophagia bacterium]|nr:hypothetical protein [Chitinophagia bacterium]